MMTKKALKLIVLCSFACFSTLQAQTKLHISNGCNYYGAETETDYFQFEPNSEARQIVNELLRSSGLSANSFRLKESNCANAMATTVNGVNYILYNPNFLRKFKQDANTKWAAYGVLAHEIGHHVNDHNLFEKNTDLRKQYELEADKFAGTLLFHLHATVDEAQACIRTIPLEGESNTHPPKSARMVAFTNGWTTAYDLSRGIQPKVVEQPTVNNEKKAKEWYNKGVAKYGSGDYKGAILDFDQTIRLKPDYANAFNYRGAAKKKLGKYTEAIEDYDEAIRLSPEYSNAFNNRGISKYFLGKYTESIRDYDQAIRLKPDNASAYFNRVVSKYNLDQNHEAIADYDQAIRIKPKYSLAFNGRGAAKNKLSQYHEAIVDYDQAIQLDPQFARAYANKGCCLVEMNNGRIGEAIDLINKGLALNPDLNYAKDCKKEALKKLSE